MSKGDEKNKINANGAATAIADPVPDPIPEPLEPIDDEALDEYDEGRPVAVRKPKRKLPRFNRFTLIMCGALLLAVLVAKCSANVEPTSSPVPRVETGETVEQLVEPTGEELQSELQQRDMTIDELQSRLMQLETRLNSIDTGDPNITQRNNDLLELLAANFNFRDLQDQARLDQVERSHPSQVELLKLLKLKQDDLNRMVADGQALTGSAEDIAIARSLSGDIDAILKALIQSYVADGTLTPTQLQAWGESFPQVKPFLMAAINQSPTTGEIPVGDLRAELMNFGSSAQAVTVQRNQEALNLQKGQSDLAVQATAQELTQKWFNDPEAQRRVQSQGGVPMEIEPVDVPTVSAEAE